MKKICILVLISISFFTYGQLGAVEIGITEAIPGVCEGNAEASEDGTITCNVGRGFDVVSGVFGSIIRYFTFIASLSAVLFIVINGILYSMSGLDAGLKDSAKKRIITTLLGLILLLLAGVILNALAPWVYK